MKNWQIFRRKSIETLVAEMAGEHRLRRVLGPVSLTSLGVGAIIGAGIFAMTGRVAAEDAGPAVMLSFVVAGVACGLAALCYAEFAALAPVAGSAYTYTYATLGEGLAWIIGWDLVLEYAMACSVVAAHWTAYFEEFLKQTLAAVGIEFALPKVLTSDPFTKIVVDGVAVQPLCNLPAMLIMALVTVVLVLGIRESAVTNAVLVIVKVAVVLLVIGAGAFMVDARHWTSVPVEQRHPASVREFLAGRPELRELLPEDLASLSGADLLARYPELFSDLTATELAELKPLKSDVGKWGVLGLLGINRTLERVDDRVRGPFLPYGISGLMMGAALVFFAYIGFDSISTHSEEAIRPERDVPLGILLSLVICTVLYMGVAGVLTGMQPYHEINPDAPVAAAFSHQAELRGNPWLNAAAWLISLGALAGMTSVLLVSFLSQARIFLAMARDGLLPKGIFAVVHPRFHTPHRSTILTGVLISLAAGLFPIRMLEEMVSIGTLMAFVLVCGAVLMLRLRRPELRRPFRCPALLVVAPLGVLVNLAMMLFLPLDTWLRLVIWLALGLALYVGYGMRHSTLRHHLERELRQSLSPTAAPLPEQ